MGSKSVGEPPLLLSASVLSAFQMAVAAAMEDLAHQHKRAQPVDSGLAEGLQVCGISIKLHAFAMICIVSSTCAESSHAHTGWLAC